MWITAQPAGIMTKAYLKYRTRITILSSLILLGWVILAARLFQIQIIDGNDYRIQGKRQAQVKVTLPATRGIIYDRKGLALTSNIIHYSIGVHPAKIEDQDSLADFLSQLTGKSPQHYLSRLESEKPFIYLERNLLNQECESLLDKQFAGVVVEKQVSRNYPHQNIASQTLGFIDVDGKGIAGIELKYDRFLKGEAGWVVKSADGLGKTQRKINYPVNQPANGADIYLTIDLEYQTLLQEELIRRIEETGARSASGILMNPQDGSILAMASVPDYDPGAPGNYPVENQKNRVITDQFEPGSTYKIVCATAALDQNTVTIDEEFNCEGGKYSFAGKIIEDWESFGLLNFSQIIEQSSNVGIIKIAERIGANSLYRYSRDYGFGALTNIGLVGETSGILRNTSDWTAISLAELSIGYEVGVTALQLTCAFATIANGGILMKPRIIDRIVSQDGVVVYSDRPEVVRKVADQSCMRALSGMLTKVVATGTGMTAGIPGWLIAGKTGTAQKFFNGRYSKSKYISNFAGFFPADNPQIVGVFVLDEPNIGYHWGGIGAAPLFKRVVQRIINLDDDLLLVTVQQSDNQSSEITIPKIESTPRPTENLVALSTVALVAQPVKNTNNCTIPDIRGMSLRKALKTIRIAGLIPKFQGSGTVAWQSPKPGLIVSPNSTCVIGLK